MPRKSALPRSDRSSSSRSRSSSSIKKRKSADNIVKKITAMTKTDKLDKDTLGIVIEKLKEIELKKRAESEEMRGYLLVREATDKVKQVGNPKYIHRFKNMTHDQKYLEYKREEQNRKNDEIFEKERKERLKREMEVFNRREREERAKEKEEQKKYFENKRKEEKEEKEERRRKRLERGYPIKSDLSSSSSSSSPKSPWMMRAKGRLVR